MRVLAGSSPFAVVGKLVVFFLGLRISDSNTMRFGNRTSRLGRSWGYQEVKGSKVCRFVIELGSDMF